MIKLNCDFVTGELGFSTCSMPSMFKVGAPVYKPAVGAIGAVVAVPAVPASPAVLAVVAAVALVATGAIAAAVGGV